MRSARQFQPFSHSNVRFLLLFQLERKHKRKKKSSRAPPPLESPQHMPPLQLSYFLQYLNRGFDKELYKNAQLLYFVGYGFRPFVECQYFWSFSSTFNGIWIPNLNIFLDLSPHSTSQDCLLTWFFVCVWNVHFGDAPVWKLRGQVRHCVRIVALLVQNCTVKKIFKLSLLFFPLVFLIF